MSRYFRAEVRSNLPLYKNHNLLSLANLDAMDEPFSGQFYMLEVSKGLDPLLKRAFSLFRRTAEGFQILFRVKGKGTSVLKDLKQGTVLTVIGPLGNGYPLPTDSESPLVIAGGIGIASVFSLVERLSKKAFVFYGARAEQELFMTDTLESFYKELVVCTDDGSCGVKGTVVDVLSDFINKRDSLHRPVIYACGPNAMLGEIAKTAASKGIKAYVSLEEHMACGIGACLGCVVKTKSGYKRVCKEGPVFDTTEIVW